MKRSIKTKMILFVSGIIFLVLICQIIFNIFLSKPYFISQKKNKIEKLFTTIKDEYEDEPETLYNITKDYEDIYNLRIIIFDDRRNIIYSSSGESILLFRKTLVNLQSPINKDIFSLNPKAVVQKIYNGNTENIMLYGLINHGGYPRFVVIQTTIKSIEETVSGLSKVNMIISIIVMIIGVVGAYLFATRFSNPIVQIEKVTKNVAVLDFSLKADENLSTHELSSLSKNVNSMSAKLKGLIDELKNTNLELQKDIDHQKQIDNMRREFVANVSHELKTPLFLLMMYSENLKNNVDGIDKDYYCDVIIDESNRLNEMVKSLLDISNIENGLTKVNMEHIDLSHLCLSLLSRTDVMFKSKQIKCKLDVARNCFVKGDKHYLEQAMQNFIINAISHTEEDKTVKIKLIENGDEITFFVFNEGENIKGDEIDNIWECFYKTNKSRVREDETHAGLGLYIVKTIIQAHYGSYGVKNHDNGVEFWFSLKKTTEK